MNEQERFSSLGYSSRRLLYSDYVYLFIAIIYKILELRYEKDYSNLFVVPYILLPKQLKFEPFGNVLTILWDNKYVCEAIRVGIFEEKGSEFLDISDRGWGKIFIKTVKLFNLV